MGFRFGVARAASAISTWGLTNVFHRPAANFPGKVALYIDPQIIGELRGRLTKGSICVVGTNGKTSTSNLLADALEKAGFIVACNRTGANLDSGVSTTLLHTKQADWGVLECDELWLARILPQLKANYVLLLNLFRDQLDRCGEIDRIQNSIASALESSSDTVLLYNADDPLCARIAGQIPNKTVPFGMAEDMHLEQNTVSDTQMCQQCSGMMEYEYRQYGQLGKYVCPVCGFARPKLSFEGFDVRISAGDLSFGVRAGDANLRLHTTQASPYMAYNLLAAYVACAHLGVSEEALQRAIDEFNPRNGRLQSYELRGRKVLLNLAKNPTGFNQNLKIIEQDNGPKAVAFFINDKEADGHDISWLWDIDFEELASQQDSVVFAGGIRRNDMQVRLKYAGIRASLIDGVADLFTQVEGDERLLENASVYLIANYTALPAVHNALDEMESHEAACAMSDSREADSAAVVTTSDPVDDFSWLEDFGRPQTMLDALGAQTQLKVVGPVPEDDDDGDGRATEALRAILPMRSMKPVVIAHLFPDLLNLYGDGGNVRILQQRCAWRGIPVEVRRVSHGESCDFSQVDLVFVGGGPDREQKFASEELMRMRDDLASFVEGKGAVLAICGGYQILGRKWLLGDELVPGLNLVPAETRRPGTSADRLIDNFALRSAIAEMPVVGYENHAGRTYLDEGVRAFGSVISSVGSGNNDETRADGVQTETIIGTYSHGPVLSKNPEVADWLLAHALEHRMARVGDSITAEELLVALPDTEERAANAFMCKKLNVTGGK